MCWNCNYSGAERHKTCRNIICFQFINDFLKKVRQTELHRLCRKFKFACFFLSKSARFEASIVNIAHCPQEVFKYFGIPSFEILNQNLPQRIFQMWSDTRKRILIFFKWFKPSRAENRTCIAHDRHP